MNILGLHCALEWDGDDTENYSRIHDAGATLFVDGKHVRSISEERLSRVKYDGNFASRSIDYVLGDIPREDVDILVYSPTGVFLCNEQCDNGQASKFLRSHFPNAKLWFVRHHICHAMSAIFTAPFNSGSFVTLDGMGSSIWDFADGSTKGYENNSIGYFDKDKRIFRFHSMKSGAGENSFGDYYSNLSSVIYNQKIGNDEDLGYIGPEGKIMGMAAYGKLPDKNKPYTFSPEFPLKQFGIDRYDYGDPVINFFDYESIVVHLKGHTHEECSNYLQHHHEQALLKMMTYLREEYSLDDDVCFAGGCFLNVCANTLLKPLFNNIHIPPVTNDCGIHFGAAIWGAYKSKETIEVPTNLALLGKSYDDYVPEEECEHFEDFDLLCDVVARAIDENKIVGWFQGRSESGPRALGARSILMSPAKAENKDILNARVKHREYWRPFAGVVLQDRVGDYFEEGFDTPYMLFSQTVKSDKIPAITHEDKSCRIQTVNDELNPRLCTLLRKFEDPILLNTSFNDGGQPIVETPEDAIMAFRSMDMDLLVIGNYLLWN